MHLSETNMSESSVGGFLRTISQLVVLIVFIFTTCTALVNEDGKISKKHEQTIFLHIGPHKTGSSHIQHYLVKIQNTLAEHQICWPKMIHAHPIMQHTGKGMSVLAGEILTQSRPSNWTESAIQSCFMNNMSVIISAEDLSTFTPPQIDILKSIFPPTIRIKVIVFYRELLARFYSTFSEVYKKNEAESSSFPVFLLRSMESYFTFHQIDDFQLVESFSKVFGLENIVIVDYDGAQAAGKDIALIFVCDILQMQCDESTIKKNYVAHENEKPNVVLLHLMYLIRFYAHTQGYVFCDFGYKAMNDLLKNYSGRKLKPPIMSTSLLPLHLYSRAVDEKYRAAYQERMLYSNQSATIESMKSLRIDMIDEMAFYNSTHWLKFLQEELRRLVFVRKLCTHNGDLVPLPAPPMPTTGRSSSNNNSKEKNSHRSLR